MTKIGTGTLTLSGANTFTGATTVSAGILQLGSTAALNSTPSVLIVSGASLDLNGTNNSATTIPITLNGTGALSNGALTNSSTTATATWAGTITLGSASSITSTDSLNLNGSINNAGFLLTIDSTSAGIAGTITMNGILSGSGGLSLYTQIDNVTVLTASNTFSGPVTIGVGGLRITNSSGLGLGPKTITMSQGTVGQPSLRLYGSGTNISLAANLSFVTSSFGGNNGGIINEKGNNTIAGNFTLTSGGGDTRFMVNAGTLTVSGNVTPSATNRSLRLDGSGNGTFSGALADGTALPVALIKNGTGNWGISGASSYSGTTSINAGTLVINSATCLGATAGITVTAGAVLDLNGVNYATPLPLILSGSGISSSGALANRSSTTATFAGLITLNGNTKIAAESGAIILSNTGTITGAGDTLTLSGASGGTLASSIGTTTGALVKNGTGIWKLSGTSTYTGGTLLNVGTLQLGNTNALGNGILSMAGSAILDLNGNNTTVTDISSSVNTATITDKSTIAGTTTLNVTTMVTTIACLITDGSSRKVAVRIANHNAVADLFTETNPNTFSGGLTLANSSAGTRMRVTSGITTVSAAGNILSSPYGTGTIYVGESATDHAQILFDTYPNNTLMNNIVFNTALGTDVGLGLRLDTTGFVFTGTLTANLAPILLGGARHGSCILKGQITGPQGLNLINTGVSFSVTLNNTGTANNYQGATSLGESTDTLVLGAVNQIPSGAGVGDVIDNGTLKLNGFSTTLNGLSGTGFVNSVSGTPTLTVGTNNVTSTFAGILQNTAGTLALTKIGTGVLTLSGDNTYDGLTTINAGTIMAGSDSALGDTTAGTTVNTGATLDIHGFDLGQEIITLAGGKITNSGATQGDAIQDLAVTSNSTIDASGNRWDIRCTSIGSCGVSVAAGKTLTQAGANGVYMVGMSTRIQYVTLNGNLSIAGTVGFHNHVYVNGSGKILVQAGGSVRVGSYGSITRVFTEVDLANNSTLMGEDATSWTSIYAGPIVVTGAVNFAPVANFEVDGNITGSGSVTVNNTGIVTLTGASSYAGTTTVAQGSLDLESPATITSAITVNSGASIGGTGTATGTIHVLAGGILSPGLSGLGTFNTSDLTLDATSLSLFDLSTHADSVIVNGNLSINGNININSIANPNRMTYTLFTVSGSISGTPVLGSIPTGYSANLILNAHNIQVQLWKTAGPGLVTAFPYQGSNEIPLTLPQLRMRFNEAIKPGTGNLLVKKASNNALVATLPASFMTITTPVDSVEDDFESEGPWTYGTANTNTIVSTQAHAGTQSMQTVTANQIWPFTGKFLNCMDMTGYDSVSVWVYSKRNGFAQIFSQTGYAWNWLAHGVRPITANTWTRISTSVDTMLNPGCVQTIGLQFDSAGTYNIDDFVLSRSTADMLTIPMDTTLVANTKYYVNVPAGFVADSAGVNYAGISDAASWTFTTFDNAPIITSNGGKDSATTKIAEKSTAVTTITATDADSGTVLHFGKYGGADSALFSVDSVTGKLSFLTAPKFATPTDSNHNNIYEIVVYASDGFKKTPQWLGVQVIGTPVFSSPNLSMPEGTTAVGTITATDPDSGVSFRYSISGGNDTNLLRIDSLGTLNFIGPPSTQAPGDVGLNNVYDIQLKVSNGISVDTQTFHITILPNNLPPIAGSGSAISWHQDTGTMSTPANPTLTLSTKFTLEAWINFTPRSDGADQAIIAKRSSTGKEDYVFKVLGTSGALQFYSHGGAYLTSTGDSFATAKTNVMDGLWHHVAVSYNDTTTKFYVDGNLDTVIASSGVLYASRGSAYIGSYNATTNVNTANGSIDEIRIWNLTRSQDSIQAAMRKIIPPKQTGLLAYYTFDEGTGSVAWDHSGHGNTLFMQKKLNPLTDWIPSGAFRYRAIMQDHPLVFSAAYNPDTNAVHFIQLVAPQHGQISFNNTSLTATYTPTHYFAGIDSLIFKASNSIATSQYTMTITVQNVNDTPKTILLSKDTIAEHMGVNSAIGTLQTIDPDSGDSHSYSLPTNILDNNDFALHGDTLVEAIDFDYNTRSSHKLVIRSTDQGGLWVEDTFAVAILKIDETPILVNFQNQMLLLDTVHHVLQTRMLPLDSGIITRQYARLHLHIPVRDSLARKLSLAFQAYPTDAIASGLDTSFDWVWVPQIPGVYFFKASIVDLDNDSTFVSIPVTVTADSAPTWVATIAIAKGSNWLERVQDSLHQIRFPANSQLTLQIHFRDPENDPFTAQLLSTPLANSSYFKNNILYVQIPNAGNSSSQLSIRAQDFYGAQDTLIFALLAADSTPNSTQPMARRTSLTNAEVFCPQASLISLWDIQLNGARTLIQQGWMEQGTNRIQIAPETMILQAQKQAFP